VPSRRVHARDAVNSYFVFQRAQFLPDDAVGHLDENPIVRGFHGSPTMACAGNPDEEILWLSGMGGPSPRAEQRAENLGGTGGQHQVLSVLLGWICLLLADFVAEGTQERLGLRCWNPKPVAVAPLNRSL